MSCPLIECRRRPASRSSCRSSRSSSKAVTRPHFSQTAWWWCSPPGTSGLEARAALAEFHPLNQAQLVQELERPVDAGDPDVVARVAQPIRDLLRREAAALPAEQLHHRLARATGPVPGLAQTLTRGALPVGGEGSGHARRLAAR